MRAWGSAPADPPLDDVQSENELGVTPLRSQGLFVTAGGVLTNTVLQEAGVPLALEGCTSRSQGIELVWPPWKRPGLLKLA